MKNKSNIKTEATSLAVLISAGFFASDDSIEEGVSFATPSMTLCISFVIAKHKVYFL